MAKPVRCPKCKRTGVYSPKWRQCTACHYDGFVGSASGEELTPDEVFDPAVSGTVREKVEALPNVVGVAQGPVDKGQVAEAAKEVRQPLVAIDYSKPIERVPEVQLVEGEPCPTCGKKVGRRTLAKSDKESEEAKNEK